MIPWFAPRRLCFLFSGYFLSQPLVSLEKRLSEGKMANPRMSITDDKSLYEWLTDSHYGKSVDQRAAVVSRKKVNGHRRRGLSGCWNPHSFYLKHLLAGFNYVKSLCVTINISSSLVGLKSEMKWIDKNCSAVCRSNVTGNWTSHHCMVWMPRRKTQIWRQRIVYVNSYRSVQSPMPVLAIE
eukprot:Gb_03329 [translate_table: standard]